MGNFLPAAAFGQTADKAASDNLNAAKKSYNAAVTELRNRELFVQRFYENDGSVRRQIDFDRESEFGTPHQEIDQLLKEANERVEEAKRSVEEAKQRVLDLGGTINLQPQQLRF